MTTLSHDISYGMFSAEGNMAVHGIVVTVRSNPGKLSWANIQNSLIALSDSDSRFSEANDTAVREYVYDLCVCYTSDFYGA
jgi:hypothetical protein